MVKSEVQRIETVLKISFANGFEELNLSFFDLKNVPVSIFQRPLLIDYACEEGDRKKTEYKSLPLEKLQKLNLSNNWIEKIDKEIAIFQKLEELDISHNRVSQLNRSLIQLSNLRSLKLNDNPILHLPDKIATLNLLEKLDISNTNIYTFPPNFQYLYNLKELNIEGCNIAILPREIVELPMLQTLKLDGNPLVEPPIEIASKGLDAIKKYYDEVDSSDEKDNLYEVKLLLVGEERVGKSTLADALSSSDFKFDLYKESTEGIDIKTWMIEKEKLDFKKDFRVNIWDFGGQEIYHATHQFFLTKRSIYFLVTEARKDLRHDDLFYWLNLIEILGGKSPVIIVNNKCDKSHAFFATDSYREKFPNIINTSDVSCIPTKEYTIRELKQSIYTILVDSKLMPDIGIELPKVWIDIRNELNLIRESGANYISNKRYVQICKKFEMSQERANFLSDYFHDLGVFLHFKSDPSLSNTIFLDFRWVTRAVYCILDNPKIISNNGFFEDMDLDHLWSKYGYNTKRVELLTLMKDEKFEVCFELEPGKYLAPQLLHPDRVKFDLSDDESSVNFEYWYKFMPKGIISRFIVKRHKLVFEKKYWKHGVILKYENTFAIVEEKYFESPKKISISIKGDAMKELLALIRESIADINASFNQIEIEEMVQCNCSTCKESGSPNFYNLNELNQRVKNKRFKIECRKEPYEKISITNLLNGIIADKIYVDEPHLPLELEQFDTNFNIQELKHSEEKLKKIKTLRNTISVKEKSLLLLEKIKDRLDKKARLKLRRYFTIFIVGNIFILSSWIYLIYIKGWDKMEPWTYIAGLVFILFDVIYFAVHHKKFSKSDVYERQLEKKKETLYLKNNFNFPDYENLKSELQNLSKDYDKILD